MSDKTDAPLPEGLERPEPEAERKLGGVIPEILNKLEAAFPGEPQLALNALLLALAAKAHAHDVPLTWVIQALGADWAFGPELAQRTRLAVPKTVAVTPPNPEGSRGN